MESNQNALFERYLKTGHQWAQHCMSNSYSDGWTVERLCRYQCGVVPGMYRERDPETLRVVEEMSRPEAEDQVKGEIQITLRQEIRSLQAISEPDLIQVEELELAQEKLCKLQTMSVQQWAADYGCTSLIPVEQKHIPGYLHLDHAYQNYKHLANAPWSNRRTEVEDLYQDGLNRMPQFQKYGLLPVDETRELLPLDPPRIYDLEKDMTLLLTSIPKELAERFQKLLENGQIQDLALRASGEIFPGRYEDIPLMEEVERGRVFSLANLPCGITRLYSQSYEDALWITIDTENITFEELCDDFQISGDNIITQVVHLQYRREPSGVYITHLDQEFIFYTMDEFDTRRRDATQKGSACPRVKSFKIDNSRIPFDLDYEVQWKNSSGDLLPPARVPFLCYVLDCYFQHKDLLREYFQNLPSSN